jgi:hypothetical protein
MRLPAELRQVSCLIASELSSELFATPTAPPEPVGLRLAGLHLDGIDVTWSFPQQYGDATVSVFRLFTTLYYISSVSVAFFFELNSANSFKK